MTTVSTEEGASTVDSSLSQFLETTAAMFALHKVLPIHMVFFGLGVGALTALFHVLGGQTYMQNLEKTE